MKSRQDKTRQVKTGHATVSRLKRTQLWTTVFDIAAAHSCTRMYGRKYRRHLPLSAGTFSGATRHLMYWCLVAVECVSAPAYTRKPGNHEHRPHMVPHMCLMSTPFAFIVAWRYIENHYHFGPCGTPCARLPVAQCRKAGKS